MSYDIRLGVKAEGLDKIIEIDRPQYDSPTYNLGKMFRACTDWDYEQSRWYNCGIKIKNIERGIKELKIHRNKYIQYEPANGWGSIESAIRTLKSMRDCIYEQAEEIPIEYLWIKW